MQLLYLLMEYIKLSTEHEQGCPACIEGSGQCTCDDIQLVMVAKEGEFEAELRSFIYENTPFMTGSGPCK